MRLNPFENASIGSKIKAGRRIYLNVAKVGGLQSQDAEGAAVVNLLQALGNAGSGVLRLLQPQA